MEYIKDPNLEDEIKNKCLIYGEFVLNSGDVSTYYFDKYLFESDPILLKKIVVQIANQGNWDNIDYVAGLEMGGISIATVLSQLLKIPMLQVRKKSKEYGTAKCIEGPECSGKHVVIIEDVITSGKAVVQGYQDLVEQGAIVHSVHCVILRDVRGKNNINRLGVTLNNLLDFSKNVI